MQFFDNLPLYLLWNNILIKVYQEVFQHHQIPNAPISLGILLPDYSLSDSIMHGVTSSDLAKVGRPKIANH